MAAMWTNALRLHCVLNSSLVAQRGVGLSDDVNSNKIRLLNKTTV